MEHANRRKIFERQYRPILRVGLAMLQSRRKISSTISRQQRNQSNFIFMLLQKTEKKLQFILASTADDLAIFSGAVTGKDTGPEEKLFFYWQLWWQLFFQDRLFIVKIFRINKENRSHEAI